MNIPPHLDEQMWRLAESGDDVAQMEFKNQHPHLSAELMKRISLVKNLVKAKPHIKGTPRFTPSRKMVTQGDTPRWLIFSATILLVCAFAFASYAGYQYFTTGKKDQTSVVSNDTKDLPPRINNASDVKQPGINQSTEPVNEPEATTDEPKQVEPMEREVVIVSSRTLVSTVLRDIANQTGITLDLAPGFEDVEVTVDYRGVPAREALQDLGRTAGFTAFEQSPNSVLIIPAVQEGTPRSSTGVIPETGNQPGSKGLPNANGTHIGG